MLFAGIHFPRVPQKYKIDFCGKGRKRKKGAEGAVTTIATIQKTQPNDNTRNANTCMVLYTALPSQLQPLLAASVLSSSYKCYH